MERKSDGYLVRLALLLEREARLTGVDIEQEITKITEKVRVAHGLRPTDCGL